MTAPKGESSTTRSHSAPKKDAVVAEPEETAEAEAASGSESLSGREAMIEVLRLAGEPLTTKVIVERVLAHPRVTGLKGLTPGATLAAKLATENKKPNGIFVRTAPGTYGLRPKEEG